MENKADSTEEMVGPLDSHLMVVVEELENLLDVQSQSACLGIETGFTDIDLMTSGLHPGELIVVAGRPNMGDFSFVTNISEHAALECGKNVVIFSMKMKPHQIARRLVASVGHVSINGLSTGNFVNDEDWTRLTHALGRLNNTNIMLLNNQTTEWTVVGLETALDEIDLAFKPDLIVVDGLHLFNVTNVSTAYDRNIQLGEQMRQLKKMALMRDVPVLATTTLNREIETRLNKRPLLRDMRDIGILEDIADTILFIYRQEVYDLDTTDKGLAEIIIAKQQHGPLGTVILSYHDNICKFNGPGDPTESSQTGGRAA